MSWWLNISRQDWSAAVEAQAERMALTPRLRITAQSVSLPHRKFERGSTYVSRKSLEEMQEAA